MPETKVIDDAATAAAALRQGAIVAFPTETVYGLGVDATNLDAVRRLFEAKGRPSDNPLIVHVGDFTQWTLAGSSLPAFAQQLLKAFSPGPITVVVPKNPAISQLVTAGLPTVGVRIPGHAQAQHLLQQANLPIAAPSANRSGAPSCTTWQAVLEDMDGRIDFVLRGDVCDVGLESTVVECTGEVPVVLRAGKISLQQIQSVIPSAKMLSSRVDHDTRALASPGVRHAHYQPQAAVRLFESVDELTSLPLEQRSRAAAFVFDQSENILCLSHFDGFAITKQFKSLECYGREFYELLRQADRSGIATIYMHLVPQTDEAAALRDRQLRAAGKKDV